MNRSAIVRRRLSGNIDRGRTDLRVAAIATAEPSAIPLRWNAANYAPDCARQESLDVSAATAPAVAVHVVRRSLGPARPALLTMLVNSALHRRARNAGERLPPPVPGVGRTYSPYP